VQMPCVPKEKMEDLFFIVLKRGTYHRFHSAQMTLLVPSRLSYTCLYSLRKVSLFCMDVFELERRFLFSMLH
jgi:hypothetical protein